jgi:hypothetical protein
MGFLDKLLRRDKTSKTGDEAHAHGHAHTQDHEHGHAHSQPHDEAGEVAVTREEQATPSAPTDDTTADRI